MKILLLPALIVFVASCDNCSDIACMPPPQVNVYFKIVDTNGNDLIANGTLTEEDIVLEPEESWNATYIYENKATFAFLEGTHDYTLKVAESEFDLTVSVGQKAKKKGECCSGFQLNSFVLDGQTISVASDYLVEITVD